MQILTAKICWCHLHKQALKLQIKTFSASLAYLCNNVVLIIPFVYFKASHFGNISDKP